MPADSLKPHVFYILCALADGDRHGLAIAREVRALSGGDVRLWPATLYGSLEELRGCKWIDEVSEHPRHESERKRYYRITRAGRAALAAEAERLSRLAKLGKARARLGEVR